ncbi:YadA-like family protein [Stenotrophomonas sp. WHRI 8082]|uniref:YadA-like family protein n=1 Tax=Stenotrophomonas sp. WHRI 8082 TaxID=3162571 RepID=UPI003555F7C3
MAAGFADTDAVNVGQLKPVVAGLGGGAKVDAAGVVTGPTYTFLDGTSHTNVGGALGNLDTRVNNIATSAGLVTRDTFGDIHVGAGVAGGTVSLRDSGVDSRILTGVKNGVGNTDAVNMSQLKPVVDSLGGGAKVGPDGTITGPTYTVDGSTVTNVGDAITNIDGRVTNNTDDISGLKDDLAAGTVGLVQQASDTANLTVGKDTGGTAVDFTNGDNASRKLIGVAAGAVSETSNEAINGSQLHGTAKSVADSLGGNSAVGTDGTITAPVYKIGDTEYTGVGEGFKAVDGSLTDLDARMDGLIGGTEGLVTYDDSTGIVSVATGKDGTKVNFAGNGVDRTLSGVAAGMADNDAANVAQLKGVTAGLGGGATVNPDGTITGPTYTVDGSTVTNVGDAITNIDGRVTNNADDISGLKDDLAAGTVGLVQQTSDTANLTVGKDTGGTAVDFAGTSDDRKLIGVAAGAVSETSNEAVNGSQLHGTAKSVADSLGGNAAVRTDGTITAPVYNIGGTDYTGVGEGFKAVDGSLTDLDARMDGLIGGTEGLVTYDDSTGIVSVATGKDGTKVNFAGNGVDRTLSGVAAGMADNDAANIAQLKGVTAGLGGGATVNPDGTITGPTYTVDGSTVTNVGDAITNIDGRVTNNADDISGLKDDLAAGTLGLVQQTSDTANLTVGKDTGGTAVDFTNGDNASRKLIGVAAGAVSETSNEAINGSQLHGTAKSVADSLGGNAAVRTDGTITAPVYNIGGTDYTGVGEGFKAVDGSLTDLDARMDGLIGGTEGLVTYDDSTGIVSVATGKDGTKVNFAGNGVDRTLSGVAAGMADNDAANIAQLKGVTAGLGGGATVNPDGTITGPTYTVDGSTVTNVGDAITNIDGRVTNNADDISGLKDDLAAGTVGLVQQASDTANLTVGKDTGGTAVDFTNGDNASRKLIGVAAGAVSETSNEAINGSQLHGTAKSVADSLGGNAAVRTDGTITAPVYNIGGTDYTGVGEGFKAVDGSLTDLDARMDGLIGGTEGLVTYDDSTGIVSVATGKDGTKVNFAGNGVDRTLSGVAAGMADNDAANIAQLKGVTAGLGGGATVNPDGTITGPTYTVDGSTVTNVGDAITNIDGRVTVNKDNITTINTRLDGLADGTVGLVQQAGADAELTVGKDTGGAAVNFAGTSGDRKLTGVAAGDLTETSTDAVNGSQLKETNDRVAVNEDNITNLDGRVTTNEGDINNLNTTVNELSNGTIGLVQQTAANADLTVGATTGGTAVNFGGIDGARRLSGVANGEADTDAATIAQLKASGLVDRDGEALGAVVYDDMSLARATLGGTNGTVLDNVANGLIASGSREGINGGQLYDMEALLRGKIDGLDGRVGVIERGVADGSIGGGGESGTGPIDLGGEGAGSVVIGDGAASKGDGAVAIGEGASASNKDSVAIGSGSTTDRDREVSVGAPGAERVIGNVAAGTRPTDAVNLKQMDDRFAAERDWSNSRFQAVDKRIDRMGAISAAYAGMAMNTAGLSGENRLGAGIGQQNGRSALAVGYQRVMGVKQNVSVSLGGAFSGSDKSMSAGAGFSW